MAKRFLILATLAGLLMGCAPPALAPILNPAGVKPLVDVRYFHGEPGDAWRHSADVYLPTSGRDWPVAVVVHGGAWVTNSKQVVDNIGFAFASAGIATVCSNYRLFPGARHPDQTMDVVHAVDWAKRELPAYGADVSNFTLIGYSAGALPVALTALDPKYLAQVGREPNATLSRVVVMSGVYDVGDLPIVPRLVFTNRPAVWRDASPIRHARGDAPPFLIMRAEHDWSAGVSMKEQSIKFHDAMQRLGADVAIREIPGCDHDHVEAQVGREPDSGTFAELMAFMARR
jgi:acetyl esterase/lipase